MRINILTIFPEMFSPLRESILGRALENELIELNIVNIRDYAENKHNKTDDYPFGGGAGMVFMPQPVFDAIENAELEPETAKRIYMSPRGRMLDKSLAEELSLDDEITILCGHYEGVDQRILDELSFQEVSIGDYILTGGELAAMVLIDTFARLIPGVLPSTDVAVDESIYSGLLEFPQYTQPREFRGLQVPEILLSGNHRAIHLWRLEQSFILTKEKRPDLFEEYVKKHFSKVIKGRTEKVQDPTGELAKDELKVLEKVLK